MTGETLLTVGNELAALANGAEFSSERLSAVILGNREVRILKVSASDVIEEPYKKGVWFDLHLFDGRQSCVHLTSVVSEATGFVVALKTP